MDENKKEYDAIYVGGNVFGGRVLAGHRLRTELRKRGYDMLIVEAAVYMTFREFKELLDKVITEKTLLIGFSTIWMNGHRENCFEWCIDDFFNYIRTTYPNVKLVCGGAKKFNIVTKSDVIYRNCDWVFRGFSDDSFPRFLDYLTEKPNHGFKYFIEDGKKVISSNELFPVTHPDDIETVFELEDNFLPHQPISLEVSRGCIFHCTFCHHPFQAIKDPDKYIRTPQSLASELRRNYELFGTYRYQLMDDTFNDSMEKLDRLHRAVDIAKLPKFEFVCYIKPELLVTTPEMIPKLIDMGLASGIVGIESLKKETRKSIGKGMDVNRVLDAIANMRSKSKVTFYAGLIVGLPHESLDESRASHQYLLKNRDTLFTYIDYKGLGINHTNGVDGISEMDKYPEKYGYRIVTKIDNKDTAYWENDFTNASEAYRCAIELNNESNLVNTAAGYDLVTAWYAGAPDQYIRDTPTIEANYYFKGVMNTKIMANNMLSRYNIKFDPLTRSKLY
jgi:hypothetical protein